MNERRREVRKLDLSAESRGIFPSMNPSSDMGQFNPGIGQKIGELAEYPLCSRY
jgi:hypothetical protein